MRGWRLGGTRLDDGASPERVTFVVTTRLADGDMDTRRRVTQMELKYARQYLNADPTSMDWTHEFRDGWWDKHLVYLVHFEDAGAYKVVITRAGTPRLAKMVAAGGTVVEVVELANRWAAIVGEHVVLELVSECRVEPPLWGAQSVGTTEFWSDSFSIGSLADVIEALDQDQRLPLWNATFRDDEDVWP